MNYTNKVVLITGATSGIGEACAAAFGAAGGQSGAPGINRVRRLNGDVEDLKHIGQVEMAPGDVFEIHTPGGGGFGTPQT